MPITLVVSLCLLLLLPTLTMNTDGVPILLQAMDGSMNLEQALEERLLHASWLLPTVVNHTSGVLVFYCRQKLASTFAGNHWHSVYMAIALVVSLFVNCCRRWTAA
jgi:hypothetical protein